VAEWSKWGDCSHTCGEGLKIRYRSVLVASAFGGAYCPAVKEYKSCFVAPCEVDCQISQWSAWSVCPGCNSYSDGSYQTRTRTILLQAANGGKNCPDLLSDTRKCHISDCEVDCVVGSWSDWSKCSVNCGNGFMNKTRSVTQMSPSRPCPPAIDYMFCYKDCPHCIYGPPVVEPCEATCKNPGQSVRRRFLSTSPAGVSVNGTLIDLCPPETCYQECDSIPWCPVDCAVSRWNDWTDCIDGVRTRWRSIVQYPKYGGMKCPDCYLEKDTCPYKPPVGECDYGEACEEGDAIATVVSL